LFLQMYPMHCPPMVGEAGQSAPVDRGVYPTTKAGYRPVLTMSILKGTRFFEQLTFDN